MKNILGLDNGTNSIGWALIKEEAGYLKSIEGIGSRIIPEGDGHREFEKGQDISKNATRRMKRGSRRMNERYKQRRNNLIHLCRSLGIVPKGLEPLFEKLIISDRKVIAPQGAFKKGDIQYKPHELFECEYGDELLEIMLGITALNRNSYRDAKTNGHSIDSCCGRYKYRLSAYCTVGALEDDGSDVDADSDELMEGSDAGLVPIDQLVCPMAAHGGAIFA